MPEVRISPISAHSIRWSSNLIILCIALEMLQEELMEVQEDRVRAEVEATRKIKANEVTYHEIVSQRDRELEMIKKKHLQQVKRNEELIQRIELEKVAVQESPAADALQNQELLLSTLNSLWQVTSDTKQVIQVLQGAPQLLFHMHKTLKDTLQKHFNGSVHRQISNRLQFITMSAQLKLISPILGVLVNMASSVEGRKMIAETAQGDLLTTILRVLEASQSENLSDCATNNKGVENPSRQQTLDRFAIARAASDGDSDELELAINSVKELALCVLSNLCVEKAVGLLLIRGELLRKLTTFVRREQMEPLRRYAVRIVKSVMDFIPWIEHGSASTIKRTSSVDVKGYGGEIKLVDCYKDVGDMITVLSKDGELKMIGLDLLSELQRIMPMEE